MIFKSGGSYRLKLFDLSDFTLCAYTVQIDLCVCHTDQHMYCYKLSPTCQDDISKLLKKNHRLNSLYFRKKQDSLLKLVLTSINIERPKMTARLHYCNFRFYVAQQRKNRLNSIK